LAQSFVATIKAFKMIEPAQESQGLLDGPDHALHIHSQLIVDVLLRQAA
jgi:hypothetical protein